MERKKWKHREKKFESYMHKMSSSGLFSGGVLGIKSCDLYTGTRDIFFGL